MDTETPTRWRSSLHDEQTITMTFVVIQLISCVQLFVTPWTVVHQNPLSMGFFRQGNWSGLPFSSPGDLPGPGIEPRSPALAGKFFTTEPPGKPQPCHELPQFPELASRNGNKLTLELKINCT